jgi:predicted SAM-dependent methyltransferase
MTVPICPICSGTEFREFRGRENAWCVGCHSLERTRYIWLYLKKLNILNKSSVVFHFGPEKGVSDKIAEIVDADNYYPLDLFPQTYSANKVLPYKFDICNDIAHEPDSSVDLIVANHILEHLPVSVDWVIAEFARLLKPGGSMILSVPMTSNPATVEDLSDLPKEERIKRFGQEDHWRVFGWREFPAMLERVLATQTVVKRDEHFTHADLHRAAIPIETVGHPTSNTLFHFVRSERTSKRFERSTDGRLARLRA